MSAGGSPARCTILLRLLAPPTIDTSRRGTPHAFARNATSASFARFSMGGAATDTFRTEPPSADTVIPSMRSARARGVSRTATRTPFGARRSGASHVGGDVIEQRLPHKDDDQDQDHRRDIDAAEIRQEIADGSQCRFRHPVQEVADDRDAAVVAIDYAERQKPAEHRLGDQQPDVNFKYRVDEPNKRIAIHPRSPSAFRSDGNRASAASQAQEGSAAAPFSRSGRGINWMQPWRKLGGSVFEPASPTVMAGLGSAIHEGNRGCPEQVRA